MNLAIILNVIFVYNVNKVITLAILILAKFVIKYKTVKYMNKILKFLKINAFVNNVSQVIILQMLIFANNIINNTVKYAHRIIVLFANKRN